MIDVIVLYFSAVRIGDYNPFFPCMHSNLQSGIPTLPCSVKVQKLKLAKEVESTMGGGTSPSSTTAVDDETFMLLACEFCDQRYSSRASLRAHMLKHDYVQRRLSSVLAMQQVSKCLPGRSQPVAPPPLASSKGGGFMCLVCLMKYTRETDLSRHLLEDHKNDRGTYVDNGECTASRQISAQITKLAFSKLLFHFFKFVNIYVYVQFGIF